MHRLDKELVEERLFELKILTGYNCKREKDQRIFGPPPYWEGPPPEKGSVLFVTNLPKDCFEDEIYRVFVKIGPLYSIRTLLNFQGYSRGYAFVTYFNSKVALEAIKKLNNFEIRKECRILVYKSFDNRSLFIGGIPKDKTKADAWNEVNKICPKFENITMYLNPKNREMNRGFLLIEFDSYQTASKCRRYMLKNKVKLWDREIQISWAQQIHECTHTLTTTKIFIRNLPEKFTKHRLYHQLLTMVPQESIKHIFTSRHFAFISFESRDFAGVAKDGLSLCCLDGEMLEVHWARPTRPKNSPVSATFASCGCNNNLTAKKILDLNRNKLNDDDSNNTVLQKQRNTELERNTEILEDLTNEKNKKIKKRPKSKKKNNFWTKIALQKKQKKTKENDIQLENINNHEYQIEEIETDVLRSEQEETNVEQFQNSSEQNCQTAEIDVKSCEQEVNIPIEHPEKNDEIEDLEIKQQNTEEENQNILSSNVYIERSYQINEAENNEYEHTEPEDHADTVINIDPYTQNETEELCSSNYQIEQAEYNPYLPIQNTDEYNIENAQQSNQLQDISYNEPTYRQNCLTEYKENQIVEGNMPAEEMTVENNCLCIQNGNYVYHYPQNILPNTNNENVGPYGNYMFQYQQFANQYHQYQNVSLIRNVYTYQNPNSSVMVNMGNQNFNQYNGMNQAMVPIMPPYQYNHFINMPIQPYPSNQYCYYTPYRYY